MHLTDFDISYKHFKTLLKTNMLDEATALCDILYKRLRNTLTFLLIYLSPNFNKITITQSAMLFSSVVVSTTNLVFTVNFFAH